MIPRDAQFESSPAAIAPPDRSRRVLIVGGGGIVASHLVSDAPPDVALHIAYGTRRPCFAGNAQVRSIESVRLEQPREALALIDRVQPDIVINAAGMNAVDECEHDPLRCRRMNVDTTANLLAARRHRPFKLVQLSSNAVYGAARGPHAPSDPRDPVNVYGRSKRDAEDLVRSDAAIEFSSADRASLIVRLSPLYGWSPAWSRVNPLPWIQRGLADRSTLDLCNDVFDSPLAADCAARILWQLVAADAAGEFNLGGADTVSRYGFGLAVAAAFDLPIATLRSVSIASFAWLAPRAPDTSLRDPRLSDEFGIASEPLLTGLARLRAAVAVASGLPVAA